MKSETAPPITTGLGLPSVEVTTRCGTEHPVGNLPCAGSWKTPGSHDSTMLASQHVVCCGAKEQLGGSSTTRPSPSAPCTSTNSAPGQLLQRCQLEECNPMDQDTPPQSPRLLNEQHVSPASVLQYQQYQRCCPEAPTPAGLLQHALVLPSAVPQQQQKQQKENPVPSPVSTQTQTSLPALPNSAAGGSYGESWRQQQRNILHILPGQAPWSRYLLAPALEALKESQARTKKCRQLITLLEAELVRQEEVVRQLESQPATSLDADTSTSSHSIAQQQQQQQQELLQRQWQQQDQQVQAQRELLRQRAQEREENREAATEVEIFMEVDDPATHAPLTPITPPQPPLAAAQCKPQLHVPPPYLQPAHPHPVSARLYPFPSQLQGSEQEQAEHSRQRLLRDTQLLVGLTSAVPQSQLATLAHTEAAAASKRHEKGVCNLPGCRRCAYLARLSLAEANSRDHAQSQIRQRALRRELLLLRATTSTSSGGSGQQRRKQPNGEQGSHGGSRVSAAPAAAAAAADDDDDDDDDDDCEEQMARQAAGAAVAAAAAVPAAPNAPRPALQPPRQRQQQVDAGHLLGFQQAQQLEQLLASLSQRRRDNLKQQQRVQQHLADMLQEERQGEGGANRAAIYTKAPPGTALAVQAELRRQQRAQQAREQLAVLQWQQQHLESKLEMLRGRQALAPRVTTPSPGSSSRNGSSSSSRSRDDSSGGSSKCSGRGSPAGSTAQQLQLTGLGRRRHSHSTEPTRFPAGGSSSSASGGTLTSLANLGWLSPPSPEVPSALRQKTAMISLPLE